MLNTQPIVRKIFLLITVCCLFFFQPVELQASDETAIFAGGCFWCLEHDLEKLPGVINAESGYSGGDLLNPTYANHEGHQEVVRIRFDPEKISYETLLRAYWRNVDPFDKNGQFCDKGDSYRAVIFTNGDEQKLAANESLENVLNELNLPLGAINVQINNQSRFWLAEDYHQNYAELNSLKYSFYRYSCGRDKRLKDVWGENAGKSEPWS